MSELPEFVVKRLEYLAGKTGRTLDELKQLYMDIFNNPWLQQDPSFKTDNERHAYALRVLWVRVVAKPPSREYLAIPFGYIEPKISKSSGVPISRIYVLVKKENKWEKNVIVCKERYAELWQDVMLFSAYKVKLFDAGSVLIATSDTKFENPQPLPTDPLTFITKHVGVDIFKLADVHRHISRREGNFVDEFDLKGLYSIVVRFHRGKRPDGTNYGFYVVSDDSVGVEDTVDEEGRVIPAQFTVWVPPSLIKYDVESEIFVYGTVSVSSDGTPFMNAIGVIPVHAKPIPPT